MLERSLSEPHTVGCRPDHAPSGLVKVAHDLYNNIQDRCSSVRLFSPERKHSWTILSFSTSSIACLRHTRTYIRRWSSLLASLDSLFISPFSQTTRRPAFAEAP
jgi:hypothetical protein